MADFLFNQLTVDQNIIFLDIYVIQSCTVFVVIQITIMVYYIIFARNPIDNKAFALLFRNHFIITRTCFQTINKK